MPASDTTWPEKGDKVAVYRHNFNGPNTVRIATVDRTTATQIILDNELRFRRSDLRLVGESVGWSGWTELRPPGNQSVRDVLAETRLRALSARIEKLLPAADEKGVAGVLAALDEIEQAVHATRQAITGKDN